DCGSLFLPYSSLFRSALPAGALLARTRRGGAIIGAVAGSARALSTIGVLTLAGLWLGIGIGPPLVALVVLAVPSLLAGAYSGVQDRKSTRLNSSHVKS